MLALQECGGDDQVIANGQKWMIDSQHASQPAWGPTPGAEPTLLHTSFAVMSLLKQPGALSLNSLREILEWIMTGLNREFM